MPLSGYLYKRAITIPNPTATAVTGAQVRLSLTAANFTFAHSLTAGGADMRIVDSDDTTVLSHWLQAWDSGGQTATLFFKTDLTAATSKTVYLYYGKAGDSSVSSYDNAMTKIATDANTLAVLHFDEGSGTSAADAVGTYPGTLNGSPAWDGTDGGNFAASSPRQAFGSGSCVTLVPASSQYINVPTLLNTVPANGSIAFWVSPTLTWNSTNNGYRLLTKINVESPSVDMIDIFIHTTGQMSVRKYKNTVLSQLFSNRTSWTSGTWYHIVLTWGAQGFRLYVNGALETFDTNTESWANGGVATTRNLVLGAYNFGGAVSNYCPMKVDEFAVFNTQLPQADIQHLYNRRNRLYKNAQYYAWTKYASNPILSPSQAWEATAVYEPSVIDEGVGANPRYRLFYTGGTTSPRIGTATANSLTGAWTKYASNPVVGGGAGGVAGLACRTWAVKDSGTYYVYYVNGTSGAFGDNILCVTSSDGITFSGPTTVLSGVNSTWETGLANPGVWKEGSSWFMLYGGRGGVGNLWRIGLATASNPLGPWTKYGSNPLSDLQLLPASNTGMYGSHGVPYKDGNNLYHYWYHVGPNGTLPTFIVHATSTDLHAWTKNVEGAVLTYDTANFPFEFDQVADAQVLEVDGLSKMLYDGDDNVGTYEAKIGLATYPGTLAALTQLSNAAVGSEVSTDTTAPVISDGAVASNGLSLVLNFTEGGTPPLLPATGVTGFTVSENGGSKAVASASRTGNTEITLTFNTPVLQGTAILGNYDPTPGNVTDSAGNELTAFSNFSITNNSTYTIPGTPTGLSANLGQIEVDLSWNAVSGATSYKVYRDGVLLTTVGTNSTTVTENINETHSYTVSALDAYNEGTQSGAVVKSTSTGGGSVFQSPLIRAMN